jgi:hypothetical protein
MTCSETVNLLFAEIDQCKAMRFTSPLNASRIIGKTGSGRFLPPYQVEVGFFLIGAGAVMLGSSASALRFNPSSMCV